MIVNSKFGFQSAFERWSIFILPVDWHCSFDSVVQRTGPGSQKRGNLKGGACRHFGWVKSLGKAVLFSGRDRDISSIFWRAARDRWHVLEISSWRKARDRWHLLDFLACRDPRHLLEIRSTWCSHRRKRYILFFIYSVCWCLSFLSIKHSHHFLSNVHPTMHQWKEQKKKKHGALMTNGATPGLNRSAFDPLCLQSLVVPAGDVLKLDSKNRLWSCVIALVNGRKRIWSEILLGARQIPESPHCSWGKGFG